MTSRQEIDRINKMTFHELRNELAYCGNNKVKEDLIRHIMFQRYQKHIELKNQIEYIKQQKKQRYIEKLKRQQEKEYKKRLAYEKKNNQKLKEPDDDNVSLDSTDFVNTGTIIKPMNELDDINGNGLFDKRDITEYDRDLTNNNLVDRLNSDIDIRTKRNTGRGISNKDKKQVDFVPPYADTAGDNYAPFDSILKSSKKDFSNIRFKK